MNYPIIWTIISIVISLVISVKVFSDIESNRLDRYVGTCSVVGIVCMVYVAFVISMLLEYYVFEKVSTLRWIIVGAIVIILQNALIFIIGALKVAKDEEDEPSDEIAEERRSQRKKRFRQIK